MEAGKQWSPMKIVVLDRQKGVERLLDTPQQYSMGQSRKNNKSRERLVMTQW